MSVTTIRSLPYSVAAGPRNMAVDETLLHSAAGVASLRFYGWSEATLSLGYFQPEKERRRDQRLATLPFVRRPSGGATLVHHHELTYALALPAGSPWQGGESWLCRMHAVIAEALRTLAVEVQTGRCSTPVPHSSFLCFHQVTPGDLLLAGHKIAGSAQRRQRGALLQHGAVLLKASEFAPSLPGIAELAGRELNTKEVRDAIAAAFGRQTGWTLRADNWSADEERRMGELLERKYSQPAWNCKR